MLRIAALMFATAGLASEAAAQVFVSPRRAGQSVVRFEPQHWQTVDLLVDEPIGDAEAGGLRLYFYERERDSAERAAAWIELAYHDLAGFFDHTPPTRFPYVLYGSYQEFLRTNLFPVGEGVLGVTSPRSLEVALPYFGDHEAFRHVSKHELAHEFTIQKFRQVAETAEVADPLPYFPLWFIEGLAEYAVFRDLSDEHALLVRDLVTQPDMYTGHGILGFWDDYPGYVLWTYQGGLARITFLEETYGEGTSVELLARSAAIPSRQGPASQVRSMQDLVQVLTGDDDEAVAAKFDTWIKRRAFAEFLQADHTAADIDVFFDTVGYLGALDPSPTGELLAYRSIVPETGRTQLRVVDPRAPKSTTVFATDHKPGSESLHPTDPRNFALGEGQLVYVTESRGRDVLVRRRFDHLVKAKRQPSFEADAGPAVGGELPDLAPMRARIRKRRRSRLHLREHGLMAVGSIDLATSGDDVVFVGMDAHSVRDLYLWRGDQVVRLTDDLYSEREVAWGEAGIVFASDATADGRSHLFWTLPTPGAVPEQLTTGPGTDRAPSVLPDGRLVWTRITDGRAQLHVRDASGPERTADLSTGAFDPGPGPGDDLWALVHHQGRKRPARVPRELLSAPMPVAPIAAADPVPLPSRSLDASVPYRPYTARNWGVDGAFGLLGYGFGGLYGSFYMSASDQLKDHGLILDVSTFGRLELTNVQLLYLNQAGRVTVGGGPFHVWRYRLDRTVPDLQLLSGERYYGGRLSARLPIDRFIYVQGDQALGGAVSFLFPGDDGLLDDDQLDTWEAINLPTRLTSESTLRLGLDTTQFHPKTGPHAGTSVLLEGTGGWLPGRQQTYAQARIDAQQYIALPFLSSGNIGLEASTGTSGGGQFARSFWLLSYDTIRAYPLFDSRLAGRHFFFTSAEAQIPLDVLVRLALANSIEGVAALDFGGVSDEIGDLWDTRVLDGVIGTNFVLGPFELRVHFARAIDIGAPLPETPTPWVTNLSLAWLGGGLFGF